LAKTEEVWLVPQIYENDVAGLFYTSGTTGIPKGVTLTNRNIVANALQGLASHFATQTVTYLHSIPMFHISAGVSTWMAFWLGGTHVVQKQFDPKSTFELIKHERVTQVTWVPTMITMLLSDPGVAEADFSSLERINYGASPISPTHLREAIEVFDCDFLQAYGTTEAAPLLTVLTPDDHRQAISGGAKEARRLLSCGREILGVSVRVVDPRGAEVGPEEVGEVIVRGANLMSGYWEKPDETKMVFRDGWYYSGDMGKFDEDGYLYLVDRKRDMIISGGENIYSIEVENALSSHPAVLECAVVGVPDEYWGEAVKAFVVLVPGKSVTMDDLIYHCRTVIAGYKCPRFLDFVEDLPKSGAGKVLKRELRDRHWQNRKRKVN
ncbi:MAG TPA: AMP-binding protein, partial [Ktedonobacteraceae bacterium]|nr:AMP-binding protein [Ktedonobacteraceae bacterium]